MAETQLHNGQPRQLNSVVRALDLLLLFREWDRGLTVMEASRALGVAKSTASRLLATLALHGFTIMDPETRRYMVGPSAFQVGNKFEGASVARAVMPMLRRLADGANCTAQIGTLEGSRILYLAVAQGGGHLRVVAEPGDERYLHSSAIGKALLASLSPEDRAVALAPILGGDGLLPVSGPKTIREPEALERELAETLERGYSISNEDAAAGVAAIGVVIPTLASLRLAISLAFPTAQFELKDHYAMVQLLKSTAVEIRDHLGGGRAGRDVADRASSIA